MRKISKFTRRQGDRAHLAEALERRVMLASAIAAFAPQVTFGVGSQPRGVVTADVNLDGKPDLIVSNGAGNSVGVLLGNGNGGFGTQATFATGTTPFGVAVADLNRDGKPDLVVANNGSGNVSVLLGNGNGTFQAQQQLGAGTQARFVAVADFNGDGKPDLTVANYGAGTVSILLGNGNGTFGGQSTFGAGAQPSSIAVGDFNRDGKLDLAVANKSGGTVSVLLGNGNGSFGGASAFGAGSAPFSVAAGDVNGDGKPDLVLAEETSGVVGVLLGNGNGSFGGQSTFGAGAIACAVVVGDVNGDGKLDIASANYSSNTVSLLLGNGNGSFAGQKTFATGSKPFALAAGDVNRDGRLDLVAADFGGNGVSVLAGDVPPDVVSINRSSPNTQNTSASSVTYGVTFNEPVTGVDATDFALALSGVTATTPVVVSGSGASYAVTVNGISGNGTLGLNLLDDGSIKDLAGNPLGAGSNLSFQPQQMVAAPSEPESVQLGDFNGDGRLDMAAVNDLNPGYMSVATGNGDGTFGAVQTLAVASSPLALAVADLNGDGNADLVVSASVESVVGVLLGNGNGTFQPQRTYAIISAGTLAVADVNMDGKPDVVAGDRLSTCFSVLIGNGNGTLAPAMTVGLSMDCGQVVAGDFNGDGKPDVVAGMHSASSGLGAVQVMLGNGNGTFQAGTTLSVGGIAPNQIAGGDVNGDGNVDLVVRTFNVSGNGSQIFSYLGNGNGTFQLALQRSVTPSGLGTLPVADLNLDGKADIAFCNPSWASVMLGNGNGTFGIEQTFSVHQNPDSLAVGDVNGDGRPDVATADGGEMGILPGVSSGNFAGQTYTVSNLPPLVTGIVRSNPAGATATGNSVSYAVSFNEAVTGVDATDFRVVTSGGVAAAGPVTVTGSGASYLVTVNGIRGSGALQLNLVDDDSIVAGAGNPLGGVGLYNSSFSGPSYEMVPVFPKLLSITRAAGTEPTTSSRSVSFTVTFDKPVTGINGLVIGGTLGGSTQPSITGGPTVYTVTFNNLPGPGTLTLGLFGMSTTHDAVGNPIQPFLPPLIVARHTVPAGNQPIAVSPGDFNGDGKPDLAVANFYGSNLSILLGNGDGSFAAQQTVATDGYPNAVVVGDVNGDGLADLIVTDNHASRLSVLMGNGNGTFAAQMTLLTGLSPNEARIGDLNNDGKPDLFVANLNSGTESIYLGNGDGTFGAQQTISVGSAPISSVGADLNGDGNLDLVVSREGVDLVEVMLGNGNGTFAQAVTYAGSGLLGSAIAADFNGDGVTDVAVAEGMGAKVGVFLGNGNGMLQAQQTMATNAGGLQTINWSDVNGDGVVDLMAGGTNNGYSVGIGLGLGNGVFSPGQTFNGGSSAWGMAVMDFNGDGRPDIAVANRAENMVTLLTPRGDEEFIGETYTIIPPQDTVAGTPGVDTFSLKRDPDGLHIDWSGAGIQSTVPIGDPNGLTINGGGGNDVITLDYSNGNPLPNLLKIVQPQGGTPSVNDVTINGIDSTHLLSGTTIDINTAKVFLKYASAGVDPVSSIQSYLQTGYANNTWNGSASPTGGSIRSSAAAGNPGLFAIGYADSADGSGTNTTANSIELMYTISGDTNLDGKALLGDFNTVQTNFGNVTGALWDQGDFTYDLKVLLGDFNVLQTNFGQILPAGGLAVASAAVAPATASTVQASGASGRQSGVVATAEAVNAGTGGTAEVDWTGWGRKKRQGRK